MSANKGASSAKVLGALFVLGASLADVGRPVRHGDAPAFAYRIHTERPLPQWVSVRSFQAFPLSLLV